MRTVIYTKSRTVRDVRKRVSIPSYPGGPLGFTTVPDGKEELFYETSLDVEALNRMAWDAAGNKSGVCNDGPLRVRILERRKL